MEHRKVFIIDAKQNKEAMYCKEVYKKTSLK
jgi:hypothetical protein